jgi:hypothetical protein
MYHLRSRRSYGVCLQGKRRVDILIRLARHAYERLTRRLKTDVEDARLLGSLICHGLAALRYTAI